MPTAAVALVDSGATHSFVAASSVEKYGLQATLGTSMSVTLADGSVAIAKETCIVPLVFCTVAGQAISCAIECRVLPSLNHDIVLV